MNDSGTVYWITGVSDAGKTTIEKLLYEKLQMNKSVEVITTLSTMI